MLKGGQEAILDPHKIDFLDFCGFGFFDFSVWILDFGTVGLDFVFWWVLIFEFGSWISDLGFLSLWVP